MAGTIDKLIERATDNSEKGKLNQLTKKKKKKKKS